MNEEQNSLGAPPLERWAGHHLFYQQMALEELKGPSFTLIYVLNFQENHEVGIAITILQRGAEAR